MNNFQQRLFFSTLFLLILTAAIYFSSFPLFRPFFTLLVILVVSGALWEYYHMPKAKGIRAQCSIGIIGSSCYIYTLFLSTISYPALSSWPVVMLGLTFFALLIYYLFNGKDSFVNSAVTIFGLAYLTLPLSALIPINFKFGSFWIVYLLIVTKMTDIGAYFIGKMWGKNKLAPLISPQKTWEGAIGGFIVAILSSFLLYLFFGQFSMHIKLTLWTSIWLAALLSILAQLGDLAESVLKRDNGVKDSSSLPGLGGVLDIVDSLIFTAPMLCLFLNWSNILE